MNKAFDIRNSKGQCIIADARFDNDECKAIRDCGGMIIRVDRNLIMIIMTVTKVNK